MPNYKEMYRKLFIAVTQATEILKEAQIECEELYINSSEDDDDKVKEFKIIAPKDKKPARKYHRREEIPHRLR